MTAPIALYKPLAYDDVQVKMMGNVVEISKVLFRNQKCRIKKIDKDTYCLLDTGEVFDFNHTTNRSESTNTVRMSIAKLRDIINMNFHGGDNELWITLTYGNDKVFEPKKLCKDFQKFMQRLRYAFGDHKIDYIYVPEPHQKGDWHIHLLLKSDKKLYISNNQLNKLWGNGFVKVNRLKNVDNIGAYVSAYLIDIKNGQKTKKGARLPLYPPGHNIYRASKGIAYPNSVTMLYSEAKKIVSSAKLTYDTNIVVGTKYSYQNLIHKEFYNLKR